VIHLLGWLVTLGMLSNSGQTLIDEVFPLSVIKNRILTVLIVEYFNISSTLFLKLVRIRCQIKFLHKDDDDEITNAAWCQGRNFLCIFVRVSSSCEYHNTLPVFLRFKFIFTDFTSFVYVHDNFNAN
jgi:hypothetical protein